MSFEKISVPSVREQFVRDIENKILSGELQIGQRLPSARDLCELMGVSLTTVSTGIAELASKGFLDVKPRGGVYVADYIQNGTPETLFAIFRYNGGHLNPHEIRSFTETRIAMDPYVVKLVSQRAPDEAIQALAEDVEKIKACAEIPEACQLVTEFYRKLYQLTDNSVFSLIYKTTAEVQKGMYALYFEKNGLDLLKSSTAGLYEALVRRDWEAAAAMAVSSMESVLCGPSAIV